MANEKGRIKTETIISCGACNETSILDPLRDRAADDVARKFGFKWRKRFGWVCPECIDSGKWEDRNNGK